jgi:N6-L-threonylcarbamoyladenine synthase
MLLREYGRLAQLVERNIDVVDAGGSNPSPPTYMKILSIETSCDETAVSIIEAAGGFKKASFKVLGNALISQIDIHKEYGGVFPSLAKREHSKNLTPLLEEVLKKSKLLKKGKKEKYFESGTIKKISKMLEREPELLKAFLEYIPTIEKPKIDAIAVTQGPGLEPALWVGVNFAKVLSMIWDKPLIPVNHMEGHVIASLLDKKSFSGKSPLHPLAFPALTLLISGGHTQLVLIKDWLKYEIIGETRDDAVGEAFDKVARMLELPYPGGPQISRLAEQARLPNAQVRSTSAFTFPRPMITSPDFDFSFSGLKTSVLYTIKKIPALTPEIKMAIAEEFENAATEVLLSKTEKALKANKIKTLILGGGVVANTHIRSSFEKMIKNYTETALYFPHLSLSTDNAVMIALAGYFNYLKKPNFSKGFKAEGNLRL